MEGGAENSRPDAAVPEHPRLSAGDRLQADAGLRFDPLPAYLQLRRWQAQFRITNPYFRSHEGVSGATLRIEGKTCVNYAGYNYLGLSGHPEVSGAAKAAIDRYGTSVSASRIASGEIPLHGELEQALADMLGVEQCLAFVSGYGTNLSTIGHLLDARDVVFHDALIHNSARLGVKLSGARRFAFPHNDFQALDRLLAEKRGRYRRALIVVEGVYSMDGDIPDLPRLIEIKKRHQAVLMIDEAHSIGVLGERGAGIGEYFGVERRDVDIWMGTLSKALAACGGYIAGDASLIEHLRYSAPGFVYSVGLSPAEAGAALAALKVMLREPGRAAQVRARAKLFLDLARQAGLDTGSSAGSALVPVVVGDSLRCLRLAQALLERGINVQPILPPAVPESAARLRFFITTDHTEAQIRTTVEAIKEAMSSTAGDAASPAFAAKAGR